MSIRNWKQGERLLAARLHCARQPNTGRRGTDLLSGTLAVEVKCWRRLPLFLRRSLDQAVYGRDWHRRQDGRERLAVAVFHQDGEHYDSAIAALALPDLEALLALRDAA